MIVNPQDFYRIGSVCLDVFAGLLQETVAFLLRNKLKCLADNRLLGLLVHVEQMVAEYKIITRPNKLPLLRIKLKRVLQVLVGVLVAHNRLIKNKKLKNFYNSKEII